MPRRPPAPRGCFLEQGLLVKSGGDLQISDFENQWKRKTADYESAKKDAASEEQDAKKKEDRWHERQAQLQSKKLKG